MKPNDKAIEAARKAYCEAAVSPMEMALEAAFAAQFPPSEDYAGLISALRTGLAFSEKNNDAADAIEAVLAERDALKAELAAANKRAANRLAVEAERDALLARNKRLQETLSYWNDTYKYSPANEQPPILEDAARLAPVDDKALVEIAAKEMQSAELAYMPAAAIDAIRPHIEAAEREKCVKAVETVGEKINVAHHERPEWEDGYLQGVHDAAAAIRSGK